jgi:hypothetical protein
MKSVAERMSTWARLSQRTGDDRDGVIENATDAAGGDTLKAAQGRTCGGNV